MSTFDVESFIHTEIEGANETNFTPVPIGDYEALIDDIKLTSRDINGREVVILDVMWDILDENLRATMNRDKVIVRQGVFLDVADGALAFGPNQNVSLGRLRDALGQNSDGTPWSFSSLRGAGPVYLRVEHRDNPNNPDNPYTDVKSVSSTPVAA
jgi:hypothetical protein